MVLHKNLFFFNIFCYFNPNHAYWNQRRLFSGNLPGMFEDYPNIEYLTLTLVFERVQSFIKLCRRYKYFEAVQSNYMIGPLLIPSDGS